MKKHTGNTDIRLNKIHCQLLVCFVLLFLSLFSFSQTQSNANAGGKRVEIVNADVLKFDDQVGNGAKRLIGNVQFKHETTLMFCDSAYFYTNNSLDAFGHIHIQQPDDSTNLYGDFLNYDGNTKKAILNKNVVLDKKDMHLTTDVLHYNTSTHIAYYATPGRIVNKENVLTSEQGYFFGKSDDLTFKKNVVLTNPQFVINCDTMRYNTVSKITYFKGPTTIKSKENTIYCEDGWYDTQKDLCRFSKNSYILSHEQKMVGDSVFYDRNRGLGRAVHHVQITDTVQRIVITGDLATHNEYQDLSMVTGKAVLMQITDNDTLYLHADTLKSIGNRPKQEPPTPIQKQEFSKSGKKAATTKKVIVQKDTISKDSTAQRLFAYYHVKFFRKDIQGKCDSMVYQTRDSTMRLYGNPTLWSEENQLTGDSVWLVVGKKSLRTMELFGTAFVISQEDSLRYNQVRGKYMKGFFKNNDLYRVNVEGNGQTIYYVKEKEKIKSVNRADCSDLHIYLKKNQMDRITFVTRPDATLFPLGKIDVKDLKLKDFTWRAHLRPLKRQDIFVWY
jgi:lipopolysaccharide export system protein LptA